MGTFVDLTAFKFDRLKVLKENGRDNSGKVLWLCICDCGNETTVRGNGLLRGNTKSCGCIKKEMYNGLRKDLKHGHAKAGKITSEYSCYTEMIQRCKNKNATGYQNYGGRGIKVCDRWLEGFKMFYKDMGPKPSKLHSIERVDVNGNYEPSNCKWATRLEQAHNTRMFKNNKSGYKGVKWDKRDSRWVAQITANYVRIHIGMFKDKEKAIQARKEAEIKYWHKQPS